MKQVVEGKETLSIKIPKEPAGDRCQRKINGTVVSGVPTWAYFIGSTWSPYIFGAVVQFMVNGASMFSSPKYWKPQNMLNTIRSILNADTFINTNIVGLFKLLEISKNEQLEVNKSCSSRSILRSSSNRCASRPISIAHPR